jgi:hypothetical protein
MQSILAEAISRLQEARIGWEAPLIKSLLII